MIVVGREAVSGLDERHNGLVNPLTKLRETLVPPLDPAGWREGLRVMATPGVAIAAWGVVTGVAMVKVGMPVPLALLMTMVVFAGSAQLAVLPLLVSGAPLPIVWVTALLVNLRFVIFAAAMRTYFSQLTWKQRLFAGYLNGDVGFALFLLRYAGVRERGTTFQWGYFFGIATVNWVSWQAASVAGILLGGLAPTEWGLELAAVLALVAVVVPMLSRVPVLLGVVVTAVLSVVTIHIPLKLGLLISVLAGVLVAVVAERSHVSEPVDLEQPA